jgi:hypothetical protein
MAWAPFTQRFIKTWKTRAGSAHTVLFSLPTVLLKRNVQAVGGLKQLEDFGNNLL